MRSVRDGVRYCAGPHRLTTVPSLGSPPLHRSPGGPSGPFFLNAEKGVITKPWFVGQFRDILRNIGLPQHQYAGHSFRIGAATTAALAGVEDSMIQTLGRWHSAAFLQYIRTPKEHLAAIAAVMARSPSAQAGQDGSARPGPSGASSQRES